MSTLKKIALAVVAIHFVVVVLHSFAHQLLSVNASPAQLAFIIPVIVIAPVVAGVMLLRFEKLGTVLLTASMVGSFVFGVYYHFTVDTIDHVAHVAQLEPHRWSQMFVATSYLLAISELLGAVVGILLLVRRSTTAPRGNHAF
ncbi:MAG TPA: hypothetical protein VFX63_01855 [Pyrinomonadaceae bacterium]|nr:hypothetical protein [Pyrinomonadaceae bacterium]